MEDAPAEDMPLVVEALAARAWPAAEVTACGGWTLRHTADVQRRRSNSALPPVDGPSSARLPTPAALRSALDAVAAYYRERAVEPVIQLAPAERHAALDAELARRGWRREAATDVLVAPLAAVLAAASVRPEPEPEPWSEVGPDSRPEPRSEVGFEPRPEPRSEVEPETDVEVEVAPTVSDGWLAAWSAIERRADAASTRRAVLERIPGTTGYAVATAGEALVGVGLAVTERGWGGLFCMATDPGFRRRGVARAVVGALAEGARRAGAERLYLQVEQGNLGAQALYAGLGFRRSHGYHYRTAP